MSDDPVMQMYEAQAIAIEQQVEINRLKREKEELEERLRRVDLGKEGRSAESSSPKLNEVWTAINDLKQQYTDMNNIQEEIRVDLNSLKETNRIDIANMQQQMEETCAAMNDLRKQCSDMNNLLEKTRADINGLHQNAAQNSPKLTQRQNKILRAFESEKAEQKPRWVKRIVEKISEQQRNTILILGGNKNKTQCAGIAVLSGDRSEWIELKLKLPYGANGSGVVYLNGEIYLFGGINNPKALYKLDKNMEWIRLADMNEGRRGITNSCLEWNGHIWVFGGVNEKVEYLKSVERYDPKENKWTQMPDMETVRAWAATALWNDKIIISGGLDSETTGTKTMEYFDPEVGCWVEFPNMPTHIGGHSLVTYRNKLILIGGAGKGTYNTVWELDPLQSNTEWKPLPPMKYPSCNFAGIFLDNEIYAIGGYQGIDLSDLRRVEIFDGERWRDGPDLPYAWCFTAAVIIPQHFADRLCAYKP